MGWVVDSLVNLVWNIYYLRIAFRYLRFWRSWNKRAWSRWLGHPCPTRKVRVGTRLILLVLFKFLSCYHSHHHHLHPGVNPTTHPFFVCFFFSPAKPPRTSEILF